MNVISKSMTAKAIATLLVPLFLGLVGLTCFFASHSRQQAMHNLEDSSKGLAVATVLTIQNAMLSGDPKRAKEALGSIGQMSFVKRVSLLDIEGDLFADSTAASDDPAHRKEELATLKSEVDKLVNSGEASQVELKHARDGSPFFRTIVPVPAGKECQRCHNAFAVGEPIGFLALDRRATAELANVSSSFQKTIVFAAFVLLLLALSIVVLMRSLVRPIRQTMDVLEAVAAGDLSRRLSIDSADELGRMAKALNTATEALSEAREQTQRLVLKNDVFLRTASDGIHVLDVKGNVLEANDSFCRMLGYTREEAMKLNVSQWDARWSAQEIENERIPSLLDHQELFETKHRRRDGQIIDVEISVDAVEIDGGRLLFCASRDITERKRAEDNLRHFATELAESNRLKDIFTDILRHDIMNPVSVVLGYLSLLLKNESDLGKLDMLRRMWKSVKNIEEMTENAAKLAVATGGNKELDYVAGDPVAVLRSLLPDFAPGLAEKNLTLTEHSTGGISASFHPIMNEVFLNLISNAIKYSPSGSRIDVAVEERGESWLLSVEDQGEGVPDQYKQGIFNRFERLDKGGVRGSGLGLTITKEIVGLHGGEIWVEDNPSGGSIFFVKVEKMPKAAHRSVRSS